MFVSQRDASTSPIIFRGKIGKLRHRVEEAKNGVWIGRLLGTVEHTLG